MASGNRTNNPIKVNKNSVFEKNASLLIDVFLENDKNNKLIQEAFNLERNKLIEEGWIKSKFNEVFSSLQGVKTIEEFGDILISELAAAIGAQVGVFFAKRRIDIPSNKNEDNMLYLAGTYGVSPRFVEKEILIGSGILGQCAKDFRTQIIEDTPDGFFSIKSGLGSKNPQCLIVMPILHENELCAVFELASLTKLTELKKRLLKEICENIGVIFQSVSQLMLTKNLYEKIAKTNYNLAIQKQALDISAIVAETDTKGKITYVNDKFCEISKYEVDELLGQDHRILNSGYHPKEFFKELWDTIKIGNVWRREVKNKTKEGSYYWVDTTIYPVKDESGKLQKFVAIRFDITSQKEAEEKLYAANASIISQKMALDSAAIVAETDLRGKITYVNDKFLEISKYSRKELMGNDHRILNSSFHPKEFFKDLWDTIKSGKVWKQEVKNKAKDGSFYWVDTTIFPFKDEVGNLQKYVAIRFDITDKKRTLEELEIATIDAKKAAQSKSSFLANMSHEIRTPLNGVISFTGLLADQKLNKDSYEYVEHIKGCSESLLMIINDILDFSKIEAGKLLVEKIPFNLKRSIENATFVFSAIVSNKGIGLDFQIGEDVPVGILGDPLRVGQVLLNLLSNSVKFTDKGFITVSVDINKKIDDENFELIFKVTDTGIGMSQSVLNGLFQSFQQADETTTRKYGGTGLGLAISFKLVDLMGGKIWVESKEGEGTCFTFTIPTQMANYVEEKNVNLVENIKYENDINLNILVAEDNKINQKLILGILKKFGFQTVMIVENGKEVIEALTDKKNKYDIIFMDVQMPVMDGHEATFIIRERIDKEIIIIGLSANVFAEDKIKAKEIGMNDYLEKPINVKKLNEVLNKVRSSKEEKNKSKKAS